MPLTLRPATAGDVPAIAGIINRAFAVEAFFIDGDRTDVDEIRPMVDAGRFLLAEDEGQLVGCVLIQAEGERGYFGLLAVEPSRQGRGAARALVDAAEARCRAAGCRAVDIRVVDLRRELFSFYERLGYRRTGEKPFPEGVAVKLPCRFVVMSKEL